MTKIKQAQAALADLEKLAKVPSIWQDDIKDGCKWLLDRHYEIIKTALSAYGSEHQRALDALEVAREVLRDNRAEFWEDWHSHMSEGEFENNPTIMDIEKTLAQINQIIGGEDE